MKAVIDQSFRHVIDGNAGCFLNRPEVDNAFVRYHAVGAGVENREKTVKPVGNVIGAENGDLGGAFEAVANVSDDTMPGVVVAPMGYWLQDSRSGNTVNAVNSARYADMGRAPTFSDTLVEVTLIA